MALYKIVGQYTSECQIPIVGWMLLKMFVQAEHMEYRGLFHRLSHTAKNQSYPQKAQVCHKQGMFLLHAETMFHMSDIAYGDSSLSDVM